MQPHEIDGFTHHRTMPKTAPKEIRDIEIKTRHVLDTQGLPWQVAEFMPSEDEVRRLLAGEPLRIWVYGRGWPLVFPMVAPLEVYDDGVHVDPPDPMAESDAPRIVRP